jgi:hypothetical protein
LRKEEDGIYFFLFWLRNFTVSISLFHLLLDESVTSSCIALIVTVAGMAIVGGRSKNMAKVPIVVILGAVVIVIVIVIVIIAIFPI